MSGNSPYKTIKSYCEKEKKNKIIERILFHKFEEELNELIDSYREGNDGSLPSSQTKHGYISTLLSSTNLAKNIRLADEELEAIFKDKIDKYKKNISKTNFWKSVWASIVASFIFIILLIAIFSVAENQVKGLFHIEGNEKTSQLEKDKTNQ